MIGWNLLQRIYHGAPPRRDPRADTAKAEVLAAAQANGFYAVPPGFLNETGVLGGTYLHVAMRELRDEGKIIPSASDGDWMEHWSLSP